MSQSILEDSVSQKHSIKTLMNDEAISDLTLFSSDGARVLASRVHLAAKSPVFRRMLFGNFAEASKKVIRLDFTGTVLRYIVEYVYTETVSFLENEKTHEDNSDVISTIIELVNAAHFFELGSLSKKAGCFAGRAMKRNPSLSIEYLVKCETPVSVYAIVVQHALPVIRSEPGLLESKSLCMISPSKMELFMKGPFHNTSELTLFKILQAWSNEENKNEHSLQGSDLCRKKEAARLTQYLALERIHPKDLSEMVASSHLVGQEQLTEAFKAQALLAVERHAVDYEKTDVWASSNSEVYCVKTDDVEVETLSCRTLRNGIHEWGIKVEELSDYMEFGVASTEHDVDGNEFLSHQSSAWVYSSRGKCFDKGEPVSGIFRRLEEGSIVRFTLDLTPDSGGTLSASVAGTDSFQLFDNMLSKFEGKEKVGFVPAVALDGKGMVRFLGFSSLPLAPFSTPAEKFSSYGKGGIC